MHHKEAKKLSNILNWQDACPVEACLYIIAEN